MEKELTEREAIKLLDSEFSGLYKQVLEKYHSIEKFWWNEDYIKSDKELDDESGRRFIKLKVTYTGHETLPESEVMKIIKGDFNEELCEMLEVEGSNEKNIDPTGKCSSNKFVICRKCRRNMRQTKYSNKHSE